MPLFATILLLALSTVSLADPQTGVIGFEPFDPKLLTDLNQYIPSKRNKFNWEVQQHIKGGECVCPDPQCPTYLNEASVCTLLELDAEVADIF
ncbi:hypothetical protein E2P81_ATG02730 [Venturia nashicola]|nr:hypothetical protein E2P81_ATG02730 [Venturia nashicola]